MKSITEYIKKTKSISTEKAKEIFNLDKLNKDSIEFIMNDFIGFLGTIKKKYSVTNSTDVKFLFSKLKNYMVNKYGSESKALELMNKCNVGNKNALAIRLGSDIDLMNNIIGAPNITSNESKLKREYKAWKSSDEYDNLKEYNENDPYEDDEDIGRAWCIYYSCEPKDTSKVKVFYINGKTSDPNVMHQINMHRVDWCYTVDDMKKNYFKANPILVSSYRKKSVDDLKNYYDDNLLD